MSKWVAALFCGFFLLASAQAASPADTAKFARFPDFEDVTISPEGDYIAAKVQLQNGIGIVVIRIKDRAITARMTMGEGQDLYRYWWVGPKRLVLSPALYFGAYAQPAITGELVGMDADGNSQDYLFGYRGERQLGTAIQKTGHNDGWAQVLQTLPDDPQHAIISVSHYERNQDNVVTEAYKLHVVSGMRSERVASPHLGESRLVADWNGVVRYAVTPGAHAGQTLSFVRDVAADKWLPLGDPQGDSTDLIPLRLSRDNQQVYLSSIAEADRRCLIQETLKDGARKTLSCDPVADLDQVIYSFDGKQAIAVLYSNDKPHMAFIDESHPDAVMLKRLQISFPGHVVMPVSQTNDGSKVILKVYSDQDPDFWYLFDTKLAKAEPLVGAYDWVDPDHMGERRPIQVKTRDGTVVHGYLTLPPGVTKPDHLPMVVHPHGGPYYISDDWKWEPLPQLLAAQGYAVLQVNFRGSGGYGQSFVEKGRRAWHTGMIDDITDAVRWTIDKGMADPKRICIYGASYGAYAAVMSAEREPDLYRCVVGEAGVYDLSKLRTDSDIIESQSGRDYIAEYLGDPATLSDASPVQHVDRLKAPLLIAHGADDVRAPLTQAESLRKVLDAQHKPYEWMVKSGERHGYYKLENRVEFQQRLLAFIDAHIGKQAASAAPAATPTPAASATGSNAAAASPSS